MGSLELQHEPRPIVTSIQISARLGHSDAEDDASTEDAERKRTLRLAQTNVGTGVRHHQIRDGPSTVFVAGPRPRQRRVEFGDPELEY